MTKKLPRAERRAQLLERAREIVRSEGTDALTLGALAERAGVSKPITYSHFSTRSGLMVALYKEDMDHQVEVLAAALKRTPECLTDVARVIARAYLDCSSTIGADGLAIAAALKGAPEMEAYQLEMMHEHVEFYQNVLQPFSTLSEKVVRRRCFGFIGAAQILSDDMVRGGCTLTEATDDLTGLLIFWFGGGH